jgi:four helix bundle protein
MALQLVRAASAIGAQLEEGQVASSRRDMAAKYAIALREAREARYWLRLLSVDSPLDAELHLLEAEALEFVKMLTTSVRKLRTPTPN